MDALLYDAMRQVRAAGFVIVDKARVHAFHIRTTVNDPSLIYDKVDTRRLVQREIITRLAADLMDHPEVVSWRYSQDANVGSVLVETTLLTIEPRWKTGEPKP